jgi:hypothetical protein
MALVGSSKRDGGGMEELEGLMVGLKFSGENCGFACKMSVTDGGIGSGEAILSKT